MNSGNILKRFLPYWCTGSSCIDSISLWCWLRSSYSPVLLICEPLIAFEQTLLLCKEWQCSMAGEMFHAGLGICCLCRNIFDVTTPQCSFQFKSSKINRFILSAGFFSRIFPQTGLRMYNQSKMGYYQVQPSSICYQLMQGAPV